MKNLLLLWFFTSFFACANEKQPAEQPEKETIPLNASNEWVSLFDGTSTNQWRGYGQAEFPAQGWVVDNEEMVIQKAPKPRPEGFGGDIITKEKFGNFELKLEFKVTEKANSGIFYFVVEEEDIPIYFNAPEFQILDDAGYIAAGDVKEGSSHLTGSNYDMQAAPAGLNKPAGKWNEARILHKDGHVEHWLNGQKTAEYQVGSTEWEKLYKKSKFRKYPGYGRAKEGHIGLQDHDHEVRFRSIKIKKI